jgi:hypothetical protein
VETPQRARWEGSAALVLADVPFVAQERLLCGAAAVEMALRHAGARGVYARDFRPLVREAEGGIRTDELAAAVRALGWQVRSGTSDLRQLEADLAEGRPVTVLLTERAGRYHYVLVVGLSADSVVVHDPGRRPGARIPVHEFVARWEGAERWSLVVLPGAVHGSAPAGGDTALLSGARPAAAPRTYGAGAAVPAQERPPHPLLERASGLFREERWREAAQAAEGALAAQPADARGWALLGTSRYLAGDPDGALRAWERGDGLRVDRVSVSGLGRTRHPVVHELLGLAPGEALRHGSLERARRRLSLLPSADASSLSYRALPGGLAVVEVVVRERALPTERGEWIPVALSAAASSEVRLGATGSSGGGEALTALARWAEARPAVGFTLGVPALPLSRGALELAVVWERERHAPPSGGPATQEARTRASLTLTEWAAGWLRWELGAGVERWRGLGDAPTARAGIALAPARGRAALSGLLEGARGRGGAPRYVKWRVDGRVDAFAAASPWRAGLRVLAAGVGAGAPRMVMPGADVGRAREGLLRAHALESDGALSLRTVGAGLVNASFDAERRVASLPFATLAVAAFMDVARVARVDASPGDARASFADAGLGLRLVTPAGTLRLDGARGDDGSRAVTLGWDSARTRR